MLLSPRRLVRCLSASLTCILFLGCLPLPGGRSLSQQVVTGKTGEDTLVSRDGDSCVVPAKTFERIRIGDTHLCAWRTAQGSGGGTLGDPQRGGLQGPVVRPKTPPKVPPTDR